VGQFEFLAPDVRFPLAERIWHDLVMPTISPAREAYRKHKLAVRMWLFGAAAAIMDGYSGLDHCWRPGVQPKRAMAGFTGHLFQQSPQRYNRRLFQHRWGDDPRRTWVLSPPARRMTFPAFSATARTGTTAWARWN
jgi:hypothetical protein